jgi:hypothetical protein
MVGLKRATAVASATTGPRPGPRVRSAYWRAGGGHGKEGLTPAWHMSATFAVVAVPLPEGTRDSDPGR